MLLVGERLVLLQLATIVCSLIFEKHILAFFPLFFKPHFQQFRAGYVVAIWYHFPSSNPNRSNTKISLESMALAAFIELTIGAYHFIFRTWVLNWTDKSLIEYDPSMGNKNLLLHIAKEVV